MNILHFTYSLSAGGRRNAIANLCEGLLSRHVKSSVCAIIAPTEDDKTKLQPRSFDKILSLDFNGHYFVHKASLLTKLNDICNKNKINLVHSHDAASQIIAAWMHKRNKSIPHVYTFHRSLNSDTSGIKNKLRNLYANKYTDIITVGSSDRKRHILKNNYFLNTNKIKLIPFGIMIEKFSYSEESNIYLREKYNIGAEDIVIGSVGHFGKEKGIDIVLHTFSTLYKNSPLKNLKLIILGKGNLTQTKFIKNLSKQLCIADKVLFPGFDDHIEKWYSCFDIFLHAPRKEAFGLVVVEAMAAGLPVVASRVGGLTDIVANNKSGYLVESSNPTKLALYVQKLIDNRQDIRNFGNQGYKLACSKFSLSNFADSYYELYRTLLPQNI